MNSSHEAPIILFDLDRTMMDTGRLSQAIKNHFDTVYAYLGVTNGSFERWTSEYVSRIGSRTLFDPSSLTEYWHTQLLALEQSKKVPSSDELLDEFNRFIRDSVRDFLYTETIQSLQQLLEMGCILCLFTQGVETWQKLKFAHAQLTQYFDQDLQFVSDDKSDPEFLQQIMKRLAERGMEDRNVWLVDDSTHIINNALVELPELRAFLVNRDRQPAVRGEYTAPSDEVRVTQIRSLEEIVSAVRSIFSA